MDADPRKPRNTGFTLLEVVVVSAILTLILGGVTSSFWTVQAAFDEQVTEADLQQRTRIAMDRVVQLTQGVLTSDTEYGPLDATMVTATTTTASASSTTSGAYEITTMGSTALLAHSLRFREVLNVTNGVPVYNNAARYFVLGPGSPVPCDGVVIGRGPDAGSVAQAAAGPDGRLGTTDDVTGAEFVAGIPAVELLLPSEFSPRTGAPLTFTIDPQSQGRLLTITMRVNAQRPDGSFLRTNDLVLSERVALRW